MLIYRNRLGSRIYKEFLQLYNKKAPQFKNEQKVYTNISQIKLHESPIHT